MNNDEPSISQNEGQEIINRKKRYRVCCINRNVCMVLIMVLCITSTVGILAFLSIYSIREEDGSLLE